MYTWKGKGGGVIEPIGKKHKKKLGRTMTRSIHFIQYTLTQCTFIKSLLYTRHCASY